MEHSTIAAIATPEGFGGIGIIKISGADAISAAASLFRHGHPCRDNYRFSGSVNNADSFLSWHLYYGHILDPDTGRVFDEVILAVMRAPHSYTREDVVEIQAHSGPRVLHSIMDLLVARGIRPALPGEFTRRAFINGRLDLTQAEAVSDLINAASDEAVDMAVSQLTGGLSSFLDPVRHAIMDVYSTIEAAIDFPESVGDEIDAGSLARRLSMDVLEPVRELVHAYESGRFLRDGFKAVIVGGPNVGKSSLLNRLVNRERAIVTDTPGTTRDCIEASLSVRGIPVILADTAGLREDPDPIERLGIEKTREYIESADVVLFVVDVTSPVRREDLHVFRELPRGRSIVVVNKADLPDSKKRFDLPPEWSGGPCFYVSALYGDGIGELIDGVAELWSETASLSNPEYVPNWRQKVQLDRIHQAVSSAAAGLAQGESLELVSIDLRESLSAMDEITGRYVDSDVLDRIFGSFCIGK